MKEEKKEKENLVSKKVQALEEKVRKQEESARKRLRIKRGRKKESEKGVLEGEQLIRKFLIVESRNPTQKWKIREEEQGVETGSERKKPKLIERNIVGSVDRKKDSDSRFEQSKSTK